MWPRVLYFLLGVTAAPLAKPILRGIVRQGVMGGILISGELQKIVAEAREEYEDIAAEAAASADRPVTTRRRTTATQS
jgi:hypothetical protein